MTKLKPGDKFAFMTILEPRPEPKGTWLCLCECGTTKAVLGRNLKSGGTQSCGCLRGVDPGAKTHGMSKHPAYLQYHRMVALCKTYTRAPRKTNKGPDDFKKRLYTPKPKPKRERQRFPRAKYDVDGQLIMPSQKPPKPPPPPRPTLLEQFGYVQRPIPIWPDVLTFELFWKAFGSTWFPGAKLVRIHAQSYAPDPLLDEGSAMRVDNLKWT